MVCFILRASARDGADSLLRDLVDVWNEVMVFHLFFFSQGLI